MKTISLKLPESLFAVLAQTAEKRGESKSTIVREAIESFVAGQVSKQNVSCLDLAKDLAGCIEGPEDLSINKELMRGYGQ
ncbi:MAG: CopG family transcriptional regulator [Desulfobacteraceae bacterium]|jgi:predicted DNA-binding protein|nr:CopG family transcriptional regulator [Desulfobacteraceae bacterium]